MSAGTPKARVRLVVVGDTLLDRDLEGRIHRLSPDAPVPVVDDPAEQSRAGGAGLAAALAAADGHEVTLVTALGGDEGGRHLAELLAEAAVEVVDLGLDGPTPEKVRIRSDGRTLLRLDRGGGGTPATDAAIATARAVARADAVLVSDYGRGVAAQPGVRAALEARHGQPLVWDPHPRGPAPVPGAELVTPNRAEARAFAEGGADAEGEASARGRAAVGPGVSAHGRALAERWSALSVCVTLGAEGALVCGPGAQAVALPASAAHGGDPCGAGDRFASALAVLLGAGVAAHDAVGTAVAAASDFVAAGGAGRAPVGRRGAGGGGLRDAGLMAAAGARLPAHGRADAAERVARVRAGGGTVVATGGCFDLLHAGHVSVLAAARALGDCLIVLLNSDASVRRLKGADRPLVGQHDRAGVLAALDAVDAVVIFDEDTPMPALSRLRPDVWAKGGDYRVEDLPEAELLERWGGRTVILPFVAGRSTTRLIEEAALRVA